MVAFDQGDNNDWILSGWRETNLTGQVEKVRRPLLFKGNPFATAIGAESIPIPSDNSLFEIRYDGFGRQVSIEENSPGFSQQELTRTRYFPLAIETRDAEQLKPGIHAKAFQRVEFDGHGRSIKTASHIENPIANDIITTVKYSPTGEPVNITRQHAGGTYRRSMEFDTLGRLMVNKEPNTGNNWRYVWDDAGRLVGTSDARGCGENFHYDGLGRLIGEDYSPCLASQAAYTPPNFVTDQVTGEGFETFYRYDRYEPDQISPEPSFNDESRFAKGNLVSVSDRGSHTRFNYDARGRVRRISRQVAKPEGVDSASPYAPHWFTSRLDYDLGDRLTRRTTGVDVAELLLNGSSEERYAYSPRGQLFGINSSYGAIVKSITYDPDGAPKQIVYGDRRSTTANFDYDSRRRLTRYKLVTPYSPVLQQLPIIHFDYRFSTYDEVGNPLMIEDQSSPPRLPSEASPVRTRQMQYDDLYRLTQIDSAYSNSSGIAPWRSPFDAEISAGDRHPLPLRALPTRIKQQTFNYDGLGNLTASSDDLSARYDRSLGSNLGYGTLNNGPNQLRSGEGLQVLYDAAGNLTELKLERPGSCPTGAADQCTQWFAYDWDEVGQLARARRWDFDGNTLRPPAAPDAPPSEQPLSDALPSEKPLSDALPSEKPSWDLNYAYSQGARVRKSATDPADLTQHTLEVFDTLRLEHTPFDPVDGSYTVKPDNVQVYPGGMAHAFWDAAIVMHLIVGDHLGSSSVVINHDTSKLVERTTYQPYGAVESDYRPDKWKSFREPYKFTGKEEDIEVGATYFGARYYQPYLGRFMSADPLTIHGLGSDLNPYAYVGGHVTSAVDPLGLRMDEVPCTGGESACYEIIDEPPSNRPQDASMQADRGEAMASRADTRQPTSFVRGDVSTSSPPQKSSVGAKWQRAVKQGLIEGAKAGAWALVDPFMVHRTFVNDGLTVFDPSASTVSKGVAGGGIVLSFIPLVGELKIPAIRLARIFTSAASSAELAHEISSIGGPGFGQTIAILETSEGVRLAGGGGRDLSVAQRIYAITHGLVPVKLARAHAEWTVLEGALANGLNPLRGVTTIGICFTCAEQLPTAFGFVIEAIEGERAFTVLPAAR